MAKRCFTEDELAERDAEMILSGKLVEFYPDWVGLHDAEVKAEALEEAADEADRLYAGSDGSEVERAWIAGVRAAVRVVRARAAAIRGERCNGRDPGYEGTCPLPLNHPEGCFNDPWADA